MRDVITPNAIEEDLDFDILRRDFLDLGRYRNHCES